MQPKLGILAGGGALPRRVIEHCRKIGRAYFVLALQGQAEADAFNDDPHKWVRLGSADGILGRLREAGVQELVMVGSVVRPPLKELRPDFKGLKILTRIGKSYFSGDDNLLRALTKELEREGFKVVGVDGLVDNLLAPHGVLGKVAPDRQATHDIELGISAACDLGARDIGQAVVVQESKIIALEDEKGTEDLIRRSAGLGASGDGGVLVKMKKPMQDRRIDLPTIGVDTISQIIEAGLDGIAIEAGNALIIDREDVIAAADDAGVFLVGVENQKSDDNAQTALVYIIAGEPSGDRLGASLIRALKEKSGDQIKFAGIGGAEMAKEGFVSRFPMKELSLMGVAEILPHLPRLMRRIRETVREISHLRPAAVVTIDSPGFTHRVAERLKGINIPLIHYVAPSVWAWKPWRAKKIAGYFDHLLALLPFEPPYFEKEGLTTTFVGHPVLESGADQGDGAGFRRSMGISEDAKVLCVLPGSRRGETSRLLPVIRRTIELMAMTDLTIVLPVVDAVSRQIEEAVKDWPCAVHVITGEKAKFDAFAASDAALAASGTVALELAMARVPSVTIYKFNIVTAVLARLLVKSKYVNLINILLEREAVPELLLEDCKPARIAPLLSNLLVDKSVANRQLESLSEALKLLTPAGGIPSDMASSVILDTIQVTAKLE